MFQIDRVGSSAYSNALDLTNKQKLIKQQEDLKKKKAAIIDNNCMTFDGFNFFSKDNFDKFDSLPPEDLSRDAINKLYDEEKQALWNNKPGIQEKIVQLIEKFKIDLYPADDWKQQDVWENISFEGHFIEWLNTQPDYIDVDVKRDLERTFTASLVHPIALVTDSRGVERVLDGNHRLLQAIVRGYDSVKVVKVSEPDFVLDEWECINFDSVE